MRGRILVRTTKSHDLVGIFVAPNVIGFAILIDESRRPRGARRYSGPRRPRGGFSHDRICEAWVALSDFVASSTVCQFPHWENVVSFSAGRAPVRSTATT